MFKTFAIAVVASVAEANVYTQGDYREGIYVNQDDFTHDHVWGHTHYEPGNVKRFDGHYAEIDGADDLAWGPNGYQNPLPMTNKDAVHNWDDAGDAYVCHSCGGHGCTLCGGYGHFHRTAQFGHHGHNLKNGFGVGHWHTYLGPKVRSSYNKYGHGIGGRYSQRWSNGYGDRYGINAGERYGLQHRWGIYNGLGKGNPSSKGSVMGYGIGQNAEVPALLPNRMDGYDDVDMTYDEGYGDDYSQSVRGGSYQDDYGYDEGYGDDWGYDEGYGDDYGYDDYGYDDYGYDDYGYDDYGYDDYGDDYGYDSHDQYLPEHNGKQLYTEFAAGYGDPVGAWGNTYWDPVGDGHVFTHSFGVGHGNHSPWNSEYERSDLGLFNYRGRPTRLARTHQPTGFYNN